MATAKELRAQSDQELKELLAQLSRELFALQNEKAVSRKLEKSHLLRAKRHDRARIMTILRERAA